MLASPGELPTGPGWAFEFKWDGMRALAHCDGKAVRFVSRNGNDATHRFPELAGLAKAVGKPCILDGEIVALDAGGRPDFGALQQRFNLDDKAEIDRQRVAHPASFLAFDVLELGGKDVTAQPYEKRRGLLEGLGLHGDHWSTPPAQRGDADAVLAASQDLGLEGIVAKRLDSPYKPGQRTPHWVKVRNRMRQEFVVGGWSEGEGSRKGHLGSLLLGFHGSDEDARKLVFIGRVGSGFRGPVLDDFKVRLAKLARKACPFDSSIANDEGGGVVHWVKPELVVEAEFSGLTHNRSLRQASFKGLRHDKPAKDVAWEQANVDWRTGKPPA